MKTWLASAILVGGAGGVGAVSLAATSRPAAPTASPPASPAGLRSATTTETGDLSRQTSALLAEDRALQRAVARARQRLGAEVATSEHSLAVLRARLVITETALAQAQAARAGLGRGPAQPLRAVTAAPASHATTGASGAGQASGAGEIDD